MAAVVDEEETDTENLDLLQVYKLTQIKLP